MSQVNTLQSLDLILEDVSAEINLSISGLEQYATDLRKTAPLKKSVEHLNKLKGVFTLLEMQGAQRLVTDAIVLIKSLAKKKTETRKKRLEIITIALARLMRYTEHVNKKPYDLPELLIPAINSMRNSINAPLLNESSFFQADVNKARPNCKMVLITTEQSAERSRHFRQMYQLGFIEILRQSNVIGGLKMMQRSMSHLESECPRPTVPNLWWIAEAMLDGFIDGSLVLKKARMKIFSRLDIQIKLVENKAGKSLKDAKLEAKSLAKEMLYLSMLSGSESEKIANVLKHYELGTADINDRQLNDESKAMRGPSDKDYSSIAETLLDEISTIKESLSNSLEHELEPLDLEQTLTQMTNLKSLLTILQIDDQTVRLTVAIDLLNSAIENGVEILEKDSKVLFIVLDSISKVVNESDLSTYSNQSSVSRETLSKEKIEVCEYTIKKIKLLMDSFLTFTRQNRKQTVLKEVQEFLAKIHSGFEQLDAPKALSIVEGCKVFVDYHLVKNPHSTSDYAISLFADIITSLEFYLDTLKFTANPSPKIIEFAEDSLLKLNRESKKQA